MNKQTQCQKVLSVLKRKNLTVRQIMVDLWVLSPTKIISELRKTHVIKDVGTGKYAVYHLRK